MNEPKKITLEMTDKSYNQIESMARGMNTSQAGVISQALALLAMVQGKKVIIKDSQQNKDLVIDTYSKTTAPSEG